MFAVIIVIMKLLFYEHITFFYFLLFQIVELKTKYCSNVVSN